MCDFHSRRRGQWILNRDDLKDCEPYVENDEGKILSPCGIAAHNVFNDTFTLVDTDGIHIPVDESASTIAWQSDVLFGYTNPPDHPDIDQWLDETVFPEGVEDAHFIVWMRNAPTRNFRKLYAITDYDISIPFTIYISSRYHTERFGGSKYVAITEISKWIGPRGFILPVMSVFVGLLCAVGACCSGLSQIRRATRKST
eukprot:GHVO01014667.1.p1 GENE.GHVO01014667.1~~GHVO01014667.1.p1  ORF type:complete len:199 (+),score=24.68 GHVO01014667.1:307-903(+)